jgi:hypothetical protein
LPGEAPFFETEGVKLFANEENAAALQKAATERSLDGYLKAHLDRLQDRDYFALLAYLEMNDEHEQLLQRARTDGPRPKARSDLSGIRAAIFALDRAGVQRWAKQRGLSPGDLR